MQDFGLVLAGVHGPFGDFAVCKKPWPDVARQFVSRGGDVAVSSGLGPEPM